MKAFNTLFYKRLASEGKPAGSKDRLAIFIAGDDAHAKAVVAKLIDEIGFDAIDTGTLVEGGRKQQPGSAIYNVPLTARDAKKTLAAMLDWSRSEPRIVRGWGGSGGDVIDFARTRRSGAFSAPTKPTAPRGWTARQVRP